LPPAKSTLSDLWRPPPRPSPQFHPYSRYLARHGKSFSCAGEARLVNPGGIDAFWHPQSRSEPTVTALLFFSSIVANRASFPGRVARGVSFRENISLPVILDGCRAHPFLHVHRSEPLHRLVFRDTPELNRAIPERDQLLPSLASSAWFSPMFLRWTAPVWRRIQLCPHAPPELPRCSRNPFFPPHATSPREGRRLPRASRSPPPSRAGALPFSALPRRTGMLLHSLNGGGRGN